MKREQIHLIEWLLILLADAVESNRVIVVRARHRGQSEILDEARRQRRALRLARRLMIFLRWGEAPASLHQVMEAERRRNGDVD